MATLTYLGAANDAAINGGNTTVDLTGLDGGSGLLEGDIVYAFDAICHADTATPSLAISGYTELHQSTNTGGGNGTTFHVAAKIQGATPDTSLTSTVTDGDVTMGHTTVVRAYRPSGSPTSTEDASTTSASGANSQPDSPSIITKQDNAVVISAHAVRVRDITVTNPTGYGNYAGHESGAEDHSSSVNTADKTVSPEGAEDPGAWSDVTQAAGRPWIAVTVAVPPDATSSPLGLDPSLFSVAQRRSTLLRM